MKGLELLSPVAVSLKEAKPVGRGVSLFNQIWGLSKNYSSAKGALAKEIVRRVYLQRDYRPTYRDISRGLAERAYERFQLNAKGSESEVQIKKLDTDVFYPLTILLHDKALQDQALAVVDCVADGGLVLAGGLCGGALVGWASTLSKVQQVITAADTLAFAAKWGSLFFSLGFQPIYKSGPLGLQCCMLFKNSLEQTERALKDIDLSHTLKNLSINVDEQKIKKILALVLALCMEERDLEVDLKALFQEQETIKKLILCANKANKLLYD